MKFKSVYTSKISKEREKKCYAFLPVRLTNGDLVFLEYYTKKQVYCFSEFYGYSWFTIERV